MIVSESEIPAALASPFVVGMRNPMKNDSGCLSLLWIRNSLSTLRSCETVGFESILSSENTARHSEHVQTNGWLVSPIKATAIKVGIRIVSHTMEPLRVGEIQTAGNGGNIYLVTDGSFSTDGLGGTHPFTTALPRS